MRTKQLLSAYLELTKPRITVLVLATASLGFLAADPGFESWSLLLFTILGTSCAAGGSSVLNHFLERNIDRQMERTKNRPIPAGLVKPASALSFGVTLVLVGVFLLVFKTNLLTAFLALLSTFLYVVIYTPMKRLTWLNTSLGAIPGALPPVGGWTAATGELEWGAWALFLILFAWQHPHFYAIAWIFRDDYGRAGFKMLPVLDADGHRTCRHVIGFSILLIVASALPAVIGNSGPVYLGGVLLLGCGMLAAGIGLARSRSVDDARRLLRASVVYLPLLLLVTITDFSFQALI
jgi:protoheme IX farnesyltransferase